MKGNPHFRVVNPAVLRAATAAATGCGRYADAPVCVHGEEDVKDPGQIYRGCPQGQTDCADQEGQDDVCCLGSGFLGPGDNIDHASCFTRDAPYGDTCLFDSGPQNQDNQDCWWDGVHP